MHQSGIRFTIRTLVLYCFVSFPGKISDQSSHVFWRLVSLVHHFQKNNQANLTRQRLRSESLQADKQILKTKMKEEGQDLHLHRN